MYQLNYLKHINAVNINVQNINFNFYYSEKKIKENNLTMSRFVDIFLYYFNFVDSDLFKGFQINIFDRSHPSYITDLLENFLNFEYISKYKVINIDIDYLYNLSFNLDIDKLTYDYLATIVGTVYYDHLMKNKKSYMYKLWSNIRYFNGLSKQLLFVEDFVSLYSKGYSNYSNLVLKVDLEFLKKFTHARYIKGFHDFIILWDIWNNFLKNTELKIIFNKNLSLLSGNYTSKDDLKFRYCSIHFMSLDLKSLNNFKIQVDSFMLNIKGLYKYNYDSSEYELI